MKFCPTCEARYDEEILRFCTKDGTPLVDENQPNFTEMPSESLELAEDDFGEETIVRYKPSISDIPPEVEETERSEAPRIVISTNEQKREQQIRSRAIPPYQGPPQNAGTGKVVALTIFGTLAVLAFGLGIFWLLGDDDPAVNSNANINTNPPDTNLSTNLNFGASNFNVGSTSGTNINANTNVNINANTNIKTPTPTPKPTPSLSNANTNTETNVNSAPPPVNTSPTNAAPTPSDTPRVSPTPAPTGRPVNLGVVNGRAVSLPKPAYPSAARQARANGQVAVQVLIDEAGNVTSAKATTGHPLLRQSAEAAARQSKFNPAVVGNKAVKSTGILLYTFIN